jgi:hypothetical protein
LAFEAIAAVVQPALAMFWNAVSMMFGVPPSTLTHFGASGTKYGFFWPAA